MVTNKIGYRSVSQNEIKSVLRISIFFGRLVHLKENRVILWVLLVLFGTLENELAF